MKKTIAILLVLVIGMVGVWAANVSSDSLILNSTVSGKYGLKIASDAAVGETLAQKIVDFNTGLTEVTTASFDDNNLDATLYVNYMTNQKIKAKVSTTMLPMASTTTGNKIGYAVTVGTNTTATEVPASTTTAVGITFFEESAVTNGMRVVSESFKIDVDSVEWEAAGAAEDYTTTWTVELTILS